MVASPLKSTREGSLPDPAGNEAHVSAEPQPKAAAILDTLNEIARELEDGGKKQPAESPGEMSIRLEKPGSRAPGPVMPRVGMERLTEPVARPRSPGRRVVFGVFVALAYVAILAVAGLFISRAVNPIASGSPGASLGAQASAAISMMAAKIDAIVHRRGGGTAPEAVGSATVSAPIEAPPPADTTSFAPAESTPPAVAESPRQDAAGSETPASAAPAASAAIAPPRAEMPVPAVPPPAMESAAPTPPVVPSTPAAPAVPSAPAAPPPRVSVESAAPAPVQPSAAPPQPAAALPRPAVEPAPAIAAPAPPPASSAPATSAAPAKTATADPTAGQEFRALGDERLRQGDVASARLFYERAADAGNARAALMLGGTYDSSFLERLGVQGMRGDPAQAASWYRRARELGEPEADARLQALPQH